MTKARKPARARATCKKCGIKFSYTPWGKGRTREVCDECQPKYGAA
jgi:hypothetical protein